MQKLEESGRFEEIVGEGEVVDPEGADRAFVLQGTLLEYGKGSVAKTVLIGFGAGRRSLRAHIIVRRRSDNEVVYDKELKVRASKKQDEKKLATSLAKKIAKEIKKRIKR